MLGIVVTGAVSVAVHVHLQQVQTHRLAEASPVTVRVTQAGRDLIGEDGLQKDKETVVSGAVFVFRPTKGTFMGEPNRFLIALLYFLP